MVMKNICFFRISLNVVLCCFLISCSHNETEEDPTIYNGDLEIKNQTKIDLFEYTKITGNLIISGNDVRNLNELTSLVSVGGDLVIMSTTISSVYGLSNLTAVGGDFKMALNKNISSLRYLSNLTSVGGKLEISYSYSLISLDGLENLTVLGGDLFIAGNYHPSYGGKALKNYCAISQLILNGQVTIDEYTIRQNGENTEPYNSGYSPTFEQIKNTGSGGCEK